MLSVIKDTMPDEGVLEFFLLKYLSAPYQWLTLCCFLCLQYKQYSTLHQLCHGWIIFIMLLVMYSVQMKVR